VTASEWGVLDGLVRVVVTRFYRDRKVFDDLYKTLLPQRISDIRAAGGRRLRVWSIGCASGEEPYTLSLLWQQLPAIQRQGMALEILATDSDARLLRRAATACYPYGSVKALPMDWRDRGFEMRAGEYCLREEYKAPVRFELHDVRQAFAFGPFDLLFCRNLAFTYFNESLQLETLKKIHAVTTEGGLLVIGAREALPAGQTLFEQFSGYRGIYTRCP
jgi:chemotaxis protein methyltransferase CheR